MDQIKIGKFISDKRKEVGLTQSELAEKLNITDRAISKWENGNCMPDVGTIPELCDIVKISIMDLFSGEKVDMKNNDKKLEENLIEMAKQKEEADKRLLNLEVVVGVVATIMFLSLVFIASYLNIPEYLKLLIIIPSFIAFFVLCLYMLLIEQKAGFYECSNCHHKYVPTYKSILFAPHFGRTRKLKCPKCNTKCWHKKVLTKY